MQSSQGKSNMSQFSKTKTVKGPHIVIDQKYHLKSLRSKHEDFNFYRGVDSLKAKWINMYAKQSQNTFPLSNKLKENVRNQLCPKVLWSGQVKVDKSSYYFEVHEQLGPSIKSMFQKIKVQLNEKQLLHLLLEMLKLVQRINNNKLVSGQLDPSLIVFDGNPKKNELYLLNCFSLKKKNEKGKVLQTKYCSRGAHLGRNISIKDDLQSICYILIDIYTQNTLLSDKLPFQYQQQKLSLQIQKFATGLPRLFVEFYNYVITLNYNDDINFYHWKTLLTKILTADFLAQPYGFLMVKNDQSILSHQSKQQQIAIEQKVDQNQFRQLENQQQKQNNLSKIGKFLGKYKFKSQLQNDIS